MSDQRLFTHEDGTSICFALHDAVVRKQELEHALKDHGATICSLFSEADFCIFSHYWKDDVRVSVQAARSQGKLAIEKTWVWESIVCHQILPWYSYQAPTGSEPLDMSEERDLQELASMLARWNKVAESPSIVYRRLSKRCPHRTSDAFRELHMQKKERIDELVRRMSAKCDERLSLGLQRLAAASLPALRETNPPPRPTTDVKASVAHTGSASLNISSNAPTQVNTAVNPPITNIVGEISSHSEPSGPYKHMGVAPIIRSEALETGKANLSIGEEPPDSSSSESDDTQDGSFKGPDNDSDGERTGGRKRPRGRPRRKSDSYSPAPKRRRTIAGGRSLQPRGRQRDRVAEDLLFTYVIKHPPGSESMQKYMARFANLHPQTPPRDVKSWSNLWYAYVRARVTAHNMAVNTQQAAQSLDHGHDAPQTAVNTIGSYEIEHPLDQSSLGTTEIVLRESSIPVATDGNAVHDTSPTT